MAVNTYEIQLPRTVAVVGVAGAIGSAVSRVLASRGVTIHGFDIAEPTSGFMDELFRPTFGVAERSPHTFTSLDVDDPDRCASEFDARCEALAPDGLVIATGLYPARSIVDETAKTVLNLLEVNAIVPSLLVRSFLKHTLTPAPSVVVTSSLAASRVRVGTAAYSTSKIALERLLTALALESRDTGARINFVRPGYVSTRSTMNPVPASYDAKMKARGASSRPEELVDVYLWLLSAGSQHVNGVSLEVDGGMHLGSLDERAWMS